MVTPIKANVTPTCMRFSSVVFSFDFICSFCSCFSYDNYIRIPQRRKFQSQCQNTLPPDEMEAFQRHTNPPTQDNVGRTAGSEEEILLKRIDATDQEATEDEKNKEESKEESGELKKDISLLSMIAFVVGLIIGSGIFITPTNVLKNSGSFGMALIVWIVGAFLAVGGGLCYCELGLLMKNSGGEYWYLKETYNFGRPDKLPLSISASVISFIFMWTTVFILKPASLAIITLTFGRYIARAMSLGCEASQVSVVLLAISAIIFLAILNCFNVKLVSRVMTVLSFAKLVACAFIVILGLWQLIIGSHLTNFTQAFSCTSTNPGDIAHAFYSVMWAYDGWNVLSYTVEEAKNVNRNLPLAIIIGIPVVGVCYLLVNVAFFAGLSRFEIMNTSATALTFGQVLLGHAGLILIPLLVSTSTIGAGNGQMYGSARLTFAAARDGSLPEALSGLHVKQKTPVAAVMFEALLAILYAASGNISSLIDSFNAAVWVFYGLNFAGVLILRITRRKEPRPFKVWLPIPIIMMLVSILLVLLPVILVPEERVSSLVAFGIILLGLPVYFFLGWSRLRPRFLNRISEKVAIFSNNFFNTISSRDKEI